MYTTAVATRPSYTPRFLDAVTLLKADHRQVEDLFQEFERTQLPVQKQLLAVQICTALTVHTEVETDLFYPAFLEATNNQVLHHCAILEHNEAADLIAQILCTSAEDEAFDSRVHVLSEMISHHVCEEERLGGMFSTARKSSMDLIALGQAMQQRKCELLGQVIVTR